MNGLVLSGGGGKGAYQIGVWKALRKLNYDIDIVTGTSVGALNAVLITQKSYLLARLIWDKIDYSVVFNDNEKGKKDLKGTIKMYGKNIIENQGMSMDNLEKLMDRIIDYKRFYSSSIDFGLITYNVSNMEPKSLTKKQIPKDKLKDYLIASSTVFPAFKLKNIDGDNYIDGGYYDIMPINHAIDMGATNIIAVDLKTIGMRQKIKNKNIPITYITPRNYIGYTLIFDKDLNRQNFQYGYNDTLKTFKVLEGNKFTFKKGSLETLNKKYLPSVKKNLLYFLGVSSNTKSKKILSLKLFNGFINRDLTKGHGMITLIEKIGKQFKLPEYKIYSINKFNFYLHVELKKTKSINRITITSDKQEITNYLYNLMVNKDLKKLKKLALAYQNEFVSAIYLYTTIKGVVQDV